MNIYQRKFVNIAKKWIKNMNRKSFLIKTVLLCGGTLFHMVFSGCKNPVEPKEELENYLSFSNNDTETVLSNKISSSSNIMKLAAIDKRPVKIAANSTTLTATPLGSKLKLTKSTGEEVFIRFGTIRTSPSIILERSDGSIIQESSIVPASSSSWSPEEWLAKAVSVLAAALIIWLGASVVKLVAAAIAYVAMNILILSIIIAAVSVLAWLLERTGWSFDGLLDLLKNGTNWIKELFRSILNS